MSYESRLYFCRKWENTPVFKDDEPMPYNVSETIAQINLSSVGNEVMQAFIDAFKTETDFGIYLPEEEEYVISDSYGKRLHYAKAADMYVPVLFAIKREDDKLGWHNWKYDILISMLQAFVPYDDIYVVHYGY